MLSKVLYWKKYWNLSRDESRIRKIYDKEIRDAKKDSAGAMENGSLEKKMNFELGKIEEKRDGLFSAELLNKAHKLKVKKPPLFDEKDSLTEYWQQGIFLPTSFFLTDFGIEKLRKKIRQEEEWQMKKQDHKRRLMFSLITGLTGLIGALIGLVSVVWL